MADTPRVTVPVEVLRRATALLDNPKAEHPHDVSYLIEELNLLLSAAPAPEGGAVEPSWRESFIADEEEGPVSGILIDLSDGSQIWTGDCSSALLNSMGDERPDVSGQFLTVAIQGKPTRVVASVASTQDGIALARALAAALATREGAPAEAGEYQVGEFIGRQPVLCRHGSTDPNNLCDYCEGDKVWPGRAQPQARTEARDCGNGHQPGCDCDVAEEDVARSKPQAREDAQPVAKPAPFDQGGIGHAMYQAFHAYRADYVLSTDGADHEPTPFERDLIEDFFAGLMAEEAFFGPIRALYDTHPAPDALRVAELEATGLNWIVAKGRLSDDEPPYGCQIMDGEEVVAEGEDITLSGAIEIALSDIAALQAEQKGGA